MNPEQLFAKLKTLVASFSPSQLVTLGVTFLLVVGILVGSTWFIQKPTYALLFSDMDAESAGQVVTRLKTLKVDYQLDAGGGAIRVPSSRVDELRLELTSQGLPSSGRIGFEIFDRTAFGATEFMEKINYRRALEGEIARTIATISEVGSARVHIAMGKDTVFGEPRPAKASVVLKLRGKRGLSTSSVAGIQGLVAGSVEGLRPEAVVILDNYGRPLVRSNEDGDDPLGSGQMERQQRMEQDMAQRVVALLEPVVGPNRVRVNVAIKLNPRSQEETEERWDPNTVLRSRQLQTEAAGSSSAQGLAAGARANMPPPPPPANGQPAPVPPVGPLSVSTGPSRNAETTSFEVSRLTRHTISPPGDVARVSLAVIVDDAQVMKKAKDGTMTATRVPRSREELQKVQGLVAAAVGLDTQRGDQLSVEQMSFDEPPQQEDPPPTLMERLGPQATDFGRIGAVLVIGLVAFFLVVRPMMRRAGFGPLPAPETADLLPGMAMVAGAPGTMPRTVADLESEIEAQLDAQLSDHTPDTLRVPVLTRRVAAMSHKEPENVARLLRTWMRRNGKSIVGIQTTQTNLSGITKAAIIALLVGEEASASLFKHLNETEIEMLAQEMAELGPISAQIVDKVLTEFHTAVVAPSHGTRGGVDYTRRVLNMTLGDHTAKGIMDRVQRSFQSTAGFSSLEKADPSQLSKFVLGEHPQTIALILARLNPSNAAQLVTLLPDSMRPDVLTRMAHLEEISPEVVTRISDVIETRLKTLAGPTLEQHGGLRAVAELFNRLERTVSAPVLEAIETRKPELAVSIRNLMFVFDDFISIDDNGMREIVQRADKKDLTIALKGASEEIRARFFSNMSKRAAEMLREEMDVLGAVRLRDVEKAQQSIVTIARKLEEEGVISTGSGGGEAYVV